ncbi:putative maltokinase, partial [Immundisolibacter sp.]|uniref:putative maltokinase n=1 Tax=Immundisolibacter sp. TaxID=1934948 RepID=UPI00356A0DEB
LPPIMDPIYGYDAVNVEAQTRSPSSLLNWLKRLIAARKNHRAFGRGTLRFLEPGNRKILAYVREWQDEKILCVVNLSRQAQPVELNLAEFRGRVPVELLGHTAFPPIGDLPYLLTLRGYGYFGFRLASDAEAPYWHQDHLPTHELPVLVLTEGWRTFLSARAGASAVRRAIAGRSRGQLQRDLLAPYLRDKRWFADKGRSITRIDILEQGEWRSGGDSWLVTVLDVHFTDGEPHSYFLPLAIAWEDDTADETLHTLLPWTLARVREKARIGVLYDAFGDDDFCRALVLGTDAGAQAPLELGRLRFRAIGAPADLAAGASQSVHHPALEQSNTSVLFGDRLFLKAYRRLAKGINPEVETGCFLTEQSPFAHAVPVCGVIDYLPDTGAPMTLALLQPFVANQGSAWRHLVDYLERFLTEPPPATAADVDPHALASQQLRLLGQRTAELHHAFARVTGDPAFDPEPVQPADVAGWVESVRAEAAITLQRLEQAHETGLPNGTRAACEALLSRREALTGALHAPPLALDGLMRSRFHGDYHLGQVLLAQDDVLITDFEGEPARPLAERRAKHSPLRDVAGMLRSLAYAAAVAVKRGTDERPVESAHMATLASAWEAQARQAFLDGYRSAIDGCPTWPADPACAAYLIDLFLIEKALYEARYELDNRPDWLDVPLTGLLNLLATRP